MIPKFFRSPFFIKWSFFCISRIVIIDILAFIIHRSLIINGPKSDFFGNIRQATENIAIYAVLCSIYYSFTVGILMLISFIFIRRSLLKWRRLETTTSGDRFLWIGEINIFNKCIYKSINVVRHVHVPIDVVHFFYSLVRVFLFGPSRMLHNFGWGDVIVHDFNKADDPAYPDCSLFHAIKLHMCHYECRTGNRFEIFQTSIFRRKTRSIHSWPHHKKFDTPPYEQPRMLAAQSGGLIFIFVDVVPSTLNVYNMRTKAVYSFDTSVFPSNWSPAYFFRERVDNELPNTIYIRVIYWNNNPSGFGHAVYSLNIVDPDQAPILISSQEIYFPNHQLLSKCGKHFYRSRGLIGFPVQLRFQNYENTVWRCICIYDLKDQSVKFAPDFQIFHDDDRNWHVWMKRNADQQDEIQLIDTVDPPCVPILTPTEVIILRPDGATIWRNRFQPTSLRNITSKLFLNQEIKRYDEKERRMITGLLLEGHF